MRPWFVAMAGLVAVASAAPAATVPERLALEEVLASAGRKVEAFFTRAQSLVCLEVVRLQPLASGLTPDGSGGRTVESELRLSWDPAAATIDPPEARVVREVLRVNGHKPRKNDSGACTTPEQQETETQPLSLLLPAQRDRYVFSLGKPGAIDGRPMLVVDYRMRRPATVTVSDTEGQPNCVTMDVDGGFKGRIWIDPSSHEVVRLDSALESMVDVRLPRLMANRPGVNDRWFLERWDTSIEFRPVRFSEPDETLVLPVSSTSLRVTRGAGSPRLRTVTKYSDYKRFMTGGRVVPGR